jgi:hypothetical protein
MKNERVYKDSSRDISLEPLKGWLKNERVREER